jgi:hypothetical protein
MLLTAFTRERDHSRPGLGCGGTCCRLTRDRGIGSTGAHGEEDAYFHPRKLGYVTVESNLRPPRRRGEIDLIVRH